MVTVYTKPNCRPCLQTKKTLDRMGIEYNEVDITKNADVLEKFVQAGHKAAPVVETADKTWSGFNLEALKSLATA